MLRYYYLRNFEDKTHETVRYLLNHIYFYKVHCKTLNYNLKFLKIRANKKIFLKKKKNYCISLSACIIYFWL